MSAFIVSSDHISALVSWAAANRVGVHTNPMWFVVDNKIATCNMLLSENVKSVNWRYRENEPVIPVEYTPPANPPSAVQVIKLCHCLAYQSCEHEAWEISLAKKILDAVIQTAIYKLPGYEAAHWSI